MLQDSINSLSISGGRNCVATVRNSPHHPTLLPYGVSLSQQVVELCYLYTGPDGEYQLLNLYAHYLVSRVQTLVYVGEDIGVDDGEGIDEDVGIDIALDIGEAIGLANGEEIAFEIAILIFIKRQRTSHKIIVLLLQCL